MGAAVPRTTQRDCDTGLPTKENRIERTVVRQPYKLFDGLRAVPVWAVVDRNNERIDKEKGVEKQAGSTKAYPMVAFRPNLRVEVIYVPLLSSLMPQRHFKPSGTYAGNGF